jgi:hypothetical protein
MIAIIATGFGFLVVLAVVIGVIDAVSAAGWRRTASERRERWESRRPEYSGPPAAYDDED